MKIIVKKQKELKKYLKTVESRENRSIQGKHSPPVINQESAGKRLMRFIKHYI